VIAPAGGLLTAQFESGFMLVEENAMSSNWRDLPQTVQNFEGCGAPGRKWRRELFIFAEEGRDYCRMFSRSRCDSLNPFPEKACERNFYLCFNKKFL
jgi:hypothetical protein